MEWLTVISFWVIVGIALAAMNLFGRSGQSTAMAKPARWRIWGWIDDRLGLSGLRYPVPAHANTFWYTLGGITFIGIVVLVVTGFWMAQYYNPDPANARASVIYLQNDATLGGVIRGIHGWTAYLVVITATLHLIRIVVTAAYKRPRELNWLVGLGLLILLLFGSVFTGTVLRWDQESYEAMSHNMEIVALFGSLGGLFTDTFSPAGMLPRLYTVHVSIVPLILAVFILVHILLIKHHGISPTAAQADAGAAPDGRLPEDKMTGHYPTHLRLMVSYGLVLAALAGTLGVVAPLAIGPAPNLEVEVTKPPFLFYWMYAFEDWFGVSGILYAAVSVFGLLALVPFLDRSQFRSLRHRRVVAMLGALLLVTIIVLSIMIAVSPAAKHLE